MNASMNIGLVRVVTLFSILLALSGMTAIASADENPQAPIMFYGAVTLNDANASSGTVINASIDGKLCGSIVTDIEGRYRRLDVTGNESDDNETITFTVCGVTAGTAVWHASTTPTPQELNLTAWDTEAPEVTNATATPASIVADGTETTQLNATIIDGCRCTVGNVTVNLSAIGGSDAQEMSRIGDTDVYAVTVNATEGTPADTYCLQVNASDVFGNYDDPSVCIELEAMAAGLPKDGDIDGDGSITMNDVIYLAKHYYGTDLFPDYGTIYADGDIDCDGSITMNDVIYLAKHYYGTDLFPDYGTLYPCE